MRRVTFGNDGAVVGERLVPTPQAVVDVEAKDDAPTVRAVVAYADQLRGGAERRMRDNPWAKPYYPTTHAARKLSQQLGPEKALEELRRRAADAERRDRARDLESDASLARLGARRAKADARRDQSRRRLTYGQRIDAAIVELQTISAAPAVQIAGDVVHGGEADRTPSWPGDPAAPALRIAREAARGVERELDLARRRTLDQEREAA